MITQICEIHFVERHDGSEGRLFDGYLVGMTNVFPDNQRFAMTPKQAIAWKVDIERRAWQWSEAQKFRMDGSPSDTRAETKVIFDNFS